MNKKEKVPKFKRDKEEKKEKIIEAFYKLVQRKGYGNITTNDVADVAGVSVGTVYRYFPQGKPSIIKNSFSKTSEQFVDKDAFSQISQENLREVISKHLQESIKSHRENIKSHIAMEVAILSNRELFQDLQGIIREFFSEIVQELQEKSPYFKQIPYQELLESMLFMNNLFEAFIHRHIFFSPIYKSDEELVDFLSKLYMKVIQGEFNG